MCISDKTEVCLFVHIIILLLFFHRHSKVYKENPGIESSKLAEWIIVRVHDLFLISFSDGNSPNRAVSSCQNAITLEKPYKIAPKVRFFVYAACG